MSSSSANKIARLAAQGRRGAGRGVRVSGGSVFPTAIIVVLALGAALIAYARQTDRELTAADVANETYYSAVGVYVCDRWVDLPAPAAGDSAETPVASAALVPGASGAVSWQPQVLAGERRARLGTLLELWGITVTNDAITFPADIEQGATFTEASDACDGAGASLQVASWSDPKDDSTRKVSIADLGSVRLTDNGQALTIGFVPERTDLDVPPAVVDLEPLLAGR